MSVVVTASGQINLNDATFHVPELRTLIATTTRGYAHIAQQVLPSGAVIRVIEPIGNDAGDSVSPRGLLTLLAREYGVRLALYEGGPTLLASFLRERLVDELFLEGRAFTPEDAPWATLLSVKLAGSHLLLRYKLK
jgi:riboflavin biosynthesis pyrimidine reductase